MRLERVGLKFAEENKRLEQQALAQAAAATYAGAVNAVPHEPTRDAARRVVELVHERLDHRPSAKRNDPVDTRPFLRSVMSEQRWGPPASIPTAPPIVQATREQLEGAILDINAQLSSRHLMNKDLVTRRDQLTAQLQALQGTR